MQVIVSPKAEKQLKRLPSTEKKKISKKLIAIKEDPCSGKKLSGELKELRSMRVWPYRIIFKVFEDREKVWIVSVSHR